MPPASEKYSFKTKSGRNPKITMENLKTDVRTREYPRIAIENKKLTSGCKNIIKWRIIRGSQEKYLDNTPIENTNMDPEKRLWRQTMTRILRKTLQNTIGGCPWDVETDWGQVHHWTDG